ncbi:MAG: hypothetical protein JW846_01295 [Dehalococcoidia bacterium]|nr:hypothetical protein [Dehalococcoidia bacterium]
MQTQKEWKATSGGIMCLVAGTWGVMSGVILTFITSSYPTVWIRLSLMETVLVNRLAPFGAALGLVAILGGVYALRRRRWGLALAGAICAAMIPPPLFVGVLAIVFISVGRDEFIEDESGHAPIDPGLPDLDGPASHLASAETRDVSGPPVDSPE